MQSKCPQFNLLFLNAAFHFLKKLKAGFTRVYLGKRKKETTNNATPLSHVSLWLKAIGQKVTFNHINRRSPVAVFVIQGLHWMFTKQFIAPESLSYHFQKQPCMFSNHDIARYYDLSEVHYRLFWRLEKSRSLHYGIWDSHTPTFHAALLNTNKVLAGIAGIKKGDAVLDAGCGVGGSSLWLAKELGCTVTGITLNAKQVKKATQFAAEAGLSGQVRFEQNDYMNTGFPDASFDVVWGLESICYASDKSQFLKEAFRLLKPGGRLIVADFFKQDNLQGKPAQLVTAFAHSWAINDFAVWDQFHQQLTNAGFSKVRAENRSKAIMPSVKRLYRAYLVGKPMAVLYRLFNGRPTSLASNNVESARLQYLTLKNGWWDYMIVCAEKQK